MVETKVINGVIWRKYLLQAFSDVNGVNKSFSSELWATDKGSALDIFDDYLPAEFYDNGYRSELVGKYKN